MERRRCTFSVQLAILIVVSLDKEGPIHDVAWSPNSQEFKVVYGRESISLPFHVIHSNIVRQICLLNQILFDQRVCPLHDFGSAPHNTISFNP